jgi:hypothetical protein
MFLSREYEISTIGGWVDTKDSISIVSYRQECFMCKFGTDARNEGDIQP